MDHRWKTGVSRVKNEGLLFVWAEIQSRLRPLCATLVETVDEPGEWAVDTPSGRPFLKLRIQKRHVGLYLLPLYYHPGAMEPELRRALHGKTTFRFNRQTALPLGALERQIEACLGLVGLY